MAVSKIWPIYQTLDKAIKYICNYDKTKDGTLIDTYRCTEKFADYEFQDIASMARKVKKSRIAYHSMISFSPEDDITPEKALELGRQIMDKYTDKDFQYVLCVHNDQKHIHIHCIFNSVNFFDHKKLQIKDKDLDRLEKITDQICRENNLSVIEEKSGIKGRGKYEYERHKENTSWKDKLRDSIDRNILLSDSYEEFIDRMQMEEGYKIKQGKYLSFTLEHEGQKKSTRNRSLGDFYSIESIKDRIANKEKYVQSETHTLEFPEEESTLPEHNLNFIYEGNKIDKLIDVGRNAKAQEHAAYRKKLSMININTYAGMINFVKKYHLIYADDFEKVLKELETKNTSITKEIHKVYSELNQLESDVKQYEKYLTNKTAHARYSSTSDKNEKYHLSEANKKYESAVYYFKRNNISINDVTPANLKQKLKKIDELKKKIESLKKERKDTINDINQLSIIKENNQKILGNTFSGIQRPSSKEEKGKNTER